MYKTNNNPPSRYKRNLKYIREKNGIRLNSRFSKLRSLVDFNPYDDSETILEKIKSHVVIQEKFLSAYYKIDIKAKSVNIGYLHNNIFKSKLNALVEYVAKCYYFGEFQIDDTTNAIIK